MVGGFFRRGRGEAGSPQKGDAAGQRPTRLTIIGLGLIGGSLGLALKKSPLPLRIVGHDRNFELARRAQKLGAVDQAEWNLPTSLEGADIVLIATPVLAVESVFRDIAPYLSPGTIVTDVASTKRQILEWADAILPDGVSFVGGHPMAGRETAGIDAADASLFEGATYCFVPSERATQAAIETMVTLARAVGAIPYFVEPIEHDSLVAAVSHLPFLLSTALADLTTHSPGWGDLSRVAGSGYRDMTRLSSGDPKMHSDIVDTNRESILTWMRAYQSQIGDLIARVEAGESLEASFTEVKARRDAWLADREKARGQRETR